MKKKKSKIEKEATAAGMIKSGGVKDLHALMEQVAVKKTKKKSKNIASF